MPSERGKGSNADTCKNYAFPFREHTERGRCGLTTQAQRPGARDAGIATTTRPPGSLQRIVAALSCGKLLRVWNETLLGPCREGIEHRRARPLRPRLSLIAQMQNGKTRRGLSQIEQDIVAILTIADSRDGTPKQNVPGAHLLVNLCLGLCCVVRCDGVPRLAPLNLGCVEITHVAGNRPNDPPPAPPAARRAI